MGYINDFRGKLREHIERGETEAAVKYAADTVLESYRNGQQEAGKGERAEGGHRTGRFTKRAPKNANVPR